MVLKYAKTPFPEKELLKKPFELHIGQKVADFYKWIWASAPVDYNLYNEEVHLYKCRC